MEVDPLHDPTLYTCRLWFNDKKIALYEKGLQTFWDFDTEMLRAWDDID